MKLKTFCKITLLKFIHFKYRKYVHYSLLTSIVLFQIILFLFIYNEFYNVNQLEKINHKLNKLKDTENNLHTTSESFFKSQKEFIAFLNEKNEIKFGFFKNNLELGFYEFEKLKGNINTNSDFSNYFAYERKEDYKNYLQAKQKLDSLHKNNPSTVSNGLKELLDLKKFDYSQILNSVQVETNQEIDSVKKKGFFGRIGNAISGKVDVQKEKMNILVSMKFGNKVSTGNVQEQLENAFKKTNEFYQNQFKKIKAEFYKNKELENALIKQSFQFIDNSNVALNAINSSFKAYKKNIENEYIKKETETSLIRKFSVFAIIVLVLLVSFILFIITKLTFKYEEKLVLANQTIQDNLIFKDKLVSMISHEIRTPLSILNLYSSQLQSKILDPFIKQIFESIKFTTNSANLLANQILEFSKNEKKELAYNPTEFQLKKEIHEVLLGLKSLAQEKNNELTLDLEIPDELIVKSDLVKLYQIFYNLIGNANKFTEKGKIHVYAGLVNNKELNVIITDTGKGIKKDDIDNIFKDFYQSVTEEKVHNLGAGLGLHLCKELIELLNGTISIESEINKGTKVNFKIIFKN